MKSLLTIHNASILLETQRLILKRFTEYDGHYLFELDNDPEVMQFINGGTATPRAVIEEKILPVFLQYDGDVPGLGFWAVIEKETSNFIGWSCLRLDENSLVQASLGYRFCKDSWRKGFATESCRGLINKGFQELGVQRIIATTYEDNLASLKVMEKLGLKFVRTFRPDLSVQETAHFSTIEPWPGNDLEYALDKADWEQQNNRGKQLS